MGQVKAESERFERRMIGMPSDLVVLIQIEQRRRNLRTWARMARILMEERLSEIERERASS